MDADAPATTTAENPGFQALDHALRTAGPGAALDQLIEQLSQRGEFRPLLDALLLKARHDLGLPLIQQGSLAEVAEPIRAAYEARYVEAIRNVGARLLETGDIPGAWPYFRAIGEPEPIAEAIEAYRPTEDDPRLGATIEVAFNQGAHPRRGFEMILDHYGTCSAITAFEHLGSDEVNRVRCAERLVRRLHDEVVANLRAEIAHRGQPLPAEGAPVAELIAGRPWLFADDAYHIDLSHLGSVVRLSPLLQDPEALGQALELTDYGRNLSPRYHSDAEPPFDQPYEDYGVYLRTLLGQDVEAGLSHFRRKLEPAPGGDEGDDSPGPASTFPAQVLVGLLLRLNRLDEAIDVAAEHLAGLHESALICPSVPQLCQRAGQPGRLARISRERGDLIHYAAAILQAASPPAPEAN